MKIGILAIAAPDWGGLFQYTQALLQALTQYGDHDLFIIKDPNFILPPLRGNNYHIVNFDNSRRIRMWQVMARHVFPGSPEYKTIKAIGLSLIISPVVSVAPLLMGVPYCAMIPDLQHKYYPNFFTPREVAVRDHDYQVAIRHARLIICESNCVKNDIQKFLHVPAKKIYVIMPPPLKGHRGELPSLSALEMVRCKYTLPEKFLFYPANFWRHKNHIKLLEAIQLLKERHNEKVFVAFAGAKQKDSEDYFDRVMQQIKKNHLEGQVACLGYVPEEEMSCLYKLATALVMPTLFESISLPVGEAFALGVPVISSNVCALPEQVGDAGVLFDPLNIEDMATKILQVWQDADLRRSLIDRGYQQVKGLTLENFAKQWEKIISLPAY